MYKLTTISHNTTGIKTVTVGFAATHLRITVIKRGTTDTTSHISIGDYSKNDGVQIVDSNYSDTTGHESRRLNGKIVNFLARVSGVITPVVVARVDESYVDPTTLASAAWTATEIKYVIETPDVNCQLKIEAWD